MALIRRGKKRRRFSRNNQNTVPHCTISIEKINKKQLEAAISKTIKRGGFS